MGVAARRRRAWRRSARRQAGDGAAGAARPRALHGLIVERRVAACAARAARRALNFARLRETYFARASFRLCVLAGRARAWDAAARSACPPDNKTSRSGCGALAEMALGRT